MYEIKIEELTAEIERLKSENARLKQITAESQQEAIVCLDMMDETYKTLVPDGSIPPDHFWLKLNERIEKLKECIANALRCLNVPDMSEAVRVSKAKHWLGVATRENS